MKILRDGKEIELTTAELEQAYRERDLQYRIEDVDFFCDRNNLHDAELDNNAKEAIALTVEDILDDSDMYWEAYWQAYATAYEEYRKET